MRACPGPAPVSAQSDAETWRCTRIDHAQYEAPRTLSRTRAAGPASPPGRSPRSLHDIGRSTRAMCPARCRQPPPLGPASRLLPFTSQAIEEFADRSLVRPLTVVSDGLACFLATKTAGVHERVVTGASPPWRQVGTLLPSKSDEGALQSPLKPPMWWRTDC